MCTEDAGLHRVYDMYGYFNLCVLHSRDVEAARRVFRGQARHGWNLSCTPACEHDALKSALDTADALLRVGITCEVKRYAGGLYGIALCEAAHRRLREYVERKGD